MIFTCQHCRAAIRRQTEEDLAYLPPEIAERYRRIYLTPRGPLYRELIASFFRMVISKLFKRGA